MITGSHAICGQLRRIRRPNDGRERVEVPFGTIGAQREAVLLSFGTDIDVEAVDERLPLSIGRGLWLRRSIVLRPGYAAWRPTRLCLEALAVGIRGHLLARVIR